MNTIEVKSIEAKIREGYFDESLSAIYAAAVERRRTLNAEQGRGYSLPKIRLRKTEGYVECVGSFMGDHIKDPTNAHRATCRHCGEVLRVVYYGRYLTTHYVPAPVVKL